MATLTLSNIRGPKLMGKWREVRATVSATSGSADEVRAYGLTKLVFAKFIPDNTANGHVLAVNVDSSLAAADGMVMLDTDGVGHTGQLIMRGR